MKDIYIIQPYQVGSKHARSLALVIPSQVVKKYKIDTSTAFALNANTETMTVTLKQTIYAADSIDGEDITTRTGGSLYVLNQQASRTP